MLVTGPTGSGKSTTLAAMIDKINTERHAHILTIEDPIEYIHSNKNCLVNQREVHSDTGGFGPALRAALREDPDIVLIGEIRDLETVEAALKIAETGHLTFASLHTNSAAQTIHRIIDVFPAGQQAQIRDPALARARGHRVSGPAAAGRRQRPRAVARDPGARTPAIRALIRDDKVHQIYGVMQAGQEKLGMQTANQSLATLYMRRLITLDDGHEGVVVARRAAGHDQPRRRRRRRRRIETGRPTRGRRLGAEWSAGERRTPARTWNAERRRTQQRTFRKTTHDETRTQKGCE